MAYNGDRLILSTPRAPAGPQVWIYGPYSSSDTQTDAVATVRAAGYISDAKQRGMRVNDVVQVVDTSTPLVSWSRVSAINATTGAATLTA